LVEEPTRRSHWIKTLAAYMVEHNMIDDLDLMVNDVVREVFEQSGELLVNITTAHPLTDEIRKDITKMLKEATKAKEVIMAEAVEPDLKGGFIARTTDAVLDDSVRSKLKQLASIK